MSTIYIAEEVDLDCSVDGDEPKTADDLRVVTDFPGAHQDSRAVGQSDVFWQLSSG